MCDKVANPSPLANSPAGSCGTDTYQGDYSVYDVQYTAPPPSGGACTSAGVKTASAVSYAATDRLCQADSSQLAACDGGVCHPDLSGPYAACIAAPGSVACPPGPLSVAHQVGTGATFSCADCSCSVGATCSGTLTLYDSADRTCTGTRYGPGEGFTERAGHVHLARNEGHKPVVVLVTYLGLKHGVNPDVPSPRPGNCPF